MFADASKGKRRFEVLQIESTGWLTSGEESGALLGVIRYVVWYKKDSVCKRTAIGGLVRIYLDNLIKCIDNFSVVKLELHGEQLSRIIKVGEMRWPRCQENQEGI